MSRIRKGLKRLFQKGTSDGQTHQNTPSDAPSPSITATSSITPATPSAGITPVDSSAASPIPPAAPSSNITLVDSSPTSPISSADPPSSITPVDSSATSPIPPAASSTNVTPEDPSTGSTHVLEEQPIDSFPPSPVNHQQPPTALSLWDRAYDALAEKKPGLVKDYNELLVKEQMAISAPNQTTSQLSAPPDPDTSGRSSRQVLLNTVIQNGLERMRDNKATIKIGDRQIVLGDQIVKASNFMLACKDWIGSAVKDSPEASLAWSGVCLILPLLTKPMTAADENEEGFAYVTSRMRYYVALEPMLRRLGQNAGVEETLMSAANDHVVDLYQAILDFQLSSVLRFYESRFKRYAHDTVTLKDWKQTLLDVQKREKTVKDTLDQINDFAVRQDLELQNKTSEDTKKAVEEILSVATQQRDVSNELLIVSKEHLSAEKDAQKERLRAKQQAELKELVAKQEAELKELLAKQDDLLRELYLMRDDNGATYEWYKSRVEPRVEGTCNWFLQQENFQKWLSQESGPLLVSADPGCGKSVLAKYLIDQGLAQQSATICYFFFKYQDQNTIRQALCALLHQLFTKKRALIQHAMESYNNKGAAKLIQSETSLWTILRDAVRDPQAGPVIFVIDALDECDELQLSEFLGSLMDIFGDQQRENAKFKVLMTSRPYEQVVSDVYENWEGELALIHIPGEEEFETISEEINNVIHYRVKRLARSHRLSDKTKSSLVTKLLAIDHRTYLWVFLVFDYLGGKGFKRTDAGINAAIQTLPETVNQAYDRILSRFRDDKTVKTVRKVLSIILAARRPLTLSEMNVAMNVNGQGRGRPIDVLDLEEDVDFKSYLRDLCGLFVNVHHDKIYFLHQTAREFLIQSSAPITDSSGLQWHHSITTRHAHSVLAETCMLYLDMINSTDTETFQEGDHHNALLDYSADHWGDHCREAEFEKGSAMVELASGLCTPDLTSHSKWASVISKRYRVRYKSSMNVLVASYLGLTPVTELLLRSGADIEGKDSEDKTALMYAAESGHEAVTRLLLENGASVEARDDGCWTALMYAARCGNEAITRLLLENGADIQAKHKYGGTALLNAASFGHEAVTRLLLENGADTEARNNYFWTPLLIASEPGYEAILRLLLDNGANIEATTRYGGTALIYAASHGREAATRLLVESGANVEAKKNDGSTALMQAADNGHEAIIRLLLDKGSDVEVNDNWGSTALILSAASGREAVVRLLLDEGANVEAKKNDGSTALMQAADNGHEAIIRLLLEKGADIDARDDDGKTALMHATVSGKEAVVRLLHERGTDVEVNDVE